MDRLDAMAVFVAVCDTNGFAPAARRLGLSPSVVTRLVAGLEARIGLRLLQRTTRSLHLTEAGARYLERVRRVLSEVEAAEEVARGDREVPRGLLVVTAPVIFGRMHVAPVLRRYMDRFPEVSVQLQLNDRNVNLVEEGIDVAVRIGALDDSTLVARRLGESRRVVVASPTYLAARGRPERPGDLATHDVALFGPAYAERSWTFREAAEDAAFRDLRVDVRPRFATNSGDAAIDFAREGGGVTRALLYQVLPFLTSGELVPVLVAYEPPPSPIQAVYPSSRMLPTKVGTLLEFIKRETSWHFEAT